jgi:hypothetical protein
MPTRDPSAFVRYIADYDAWIAAGRSRTLAEQRRIDDHLERTTVEAGAPTRRASRIFSM